MNGVDDYSALPLAELAEIERDGISSDAIQSGTFYVGLENVTSDGEFVDVRAVEAGELASTKFKFTPQHLLYGKLRPYLRKIARPTFAGICSTDILPILPGPGIDRDYLFHYLRQESVVAKANSLTAGANLPRLSPKSLAEFPIPTPPVAEQRRIASILDQAEALRAKRRQALAKLDTLIQSLFLDLFGDPRTNPKCFTKLALSELIKVKSGESILVSQLTSTGRHPVYGGNGINGYHDHFMFELPVIVIGRVGVYCGAVHVTEGPAWVTDNALFVEKMSPDLHITYLAAALKFANLNQYAGRAAQPLVSGSRIYPVEILVPPRELQEDYAGRTAVLKRVKSVQNTSREKLDALFASLQHRAFRGEL